MTFCYRKETWILPKLSVAQLKNLDPIGFHCYGITTRTQGGTMRKANKEFNYWNQLKWRTTINS